MKSRICIASAAEAALALITAVAVLLSFAFSVSADAIAADAPVRVAIIDSGISVKHLDASRVLEGENFVFPDKDTADRIGHGTAVAGLIIGSVDCMIPSASLDAVLVPLVCADTYPSGTVKKADAPTVAEAIIAAVDKYGCKVINLSMGFTEPDETLASAISYADSRGAVVVAATGNDNIIDPDRRYYPAVYDGVLGVGASDQNGSIAEFSGRHGADLLAPGERIATATNKNSDEAAIVSGTSYACAYVSAALAELADNYETALELRTALLETVRVYGTYRVIGIKSRAIMPDSLKKYLREISRKYFFAILRMCDADCRKSQNENLTEIKYFQNT